MSLKKILLAVFISAALLSATPVLADSATVSEIADELICQCGCTMVLSNCTHAECSSRSAMTAIIGQKLDQGESKEQIIDYFVSQYGEQVLSSPPKKGFNLVAWLLPFAAILAGGVVIYLSLKAWVRRGNRHQADATGDIIEEEDEAYRQQLKEELDEFEEGGFR